MNKKSSKNSNSSLESLRRSLENLEKAREVSERSRLRLEKLISQLEGQRKQAPATIEDLARQNFDKVHSKLYLNPATLRAFSYVYYN